MPFFPEPFVPLASVARWRSSNVYFWKTQPCLRDLMLLQKNSAINKFAMTGSCPELGHFHIPSNHPHRIEHRDPFGSEFRHQTDGDSKNQTCANVGMKVLGTSVLGQYRNYKNGFVQQPTHQRCFSNSLRRISSALSFPTERVTIACPIRRQDNRSSSTTRELKYCTDNRRFVFVP